MSERLEPLPEGCPGDRRLSVLKVIHGYPPRFNAGSEVYSQLVCLGLARAGHQVHVFTRAESPSDPEYMVWAERDQLDPGVELTVVNMARARDGYRHAEVDRAFAATLERVHPDVVHVGHLNHLSTSLVQEAARRGIPLVFTIHDFWPLCPRGQFIRFYSPDEPWALCPGQDDRECARMCFRRYFGGSPEDRATDEEYWRGWVGRRMRHMREVMSQFDVLLAPSRHILGTFRRSPGVPADRLVYLPYAFDLSRLVGRVRSTETAGTGPVFGYIGTHIPAKGVRLLVDAFAGLRGQATLRIWGRYQEPDTRALRQHCTRLATDVRKRIDWKKEYRNQDIVADVFNHVDVIVVPSIWMENLPLVIHEALQARVAVVTADVAGMAELVRHEHNGLLFRHRSVEDLRRQMQRLVDDPGLAATLGARGHLESESGDIPAIERHIREIEGIYAGLVARRPGGRG